MPARSTTHWHLFFVGRHCGEGRSGRYSAPAARALGDEVARLTEVVARACGEHSLAASVWRCAWVEVYLPDDWWQGEVEPEAKEAA